MHLRMDPATLATAFQPNSKWTQGIKHTSGIPPDMKIVGCIWHCSSQMTLIVESAEFEEVASGATPPDLNPESIQEQVGARVSR